MERQHTATLDAVAELAVTDPDFTDVPGMCEKFVRQCLEARYGSQFDGYCRASALDSMDAWSWSEYAVDPSSDGGLPGDIYFFGDSHGPNGHVGIRVTGNRLCENSSAHPDGPNGAKGFRPLDVVGDPDLIVRLPGANP